MSKEQTKEKQVTAVQYIEEYLKWKGIIKTDNSPQVLVGIINEAKKREKDLVRDFQCPYIGGWEDEEFEWEWNNRFNN